MSKLLIVSMTLGVALSQQLFPIDAPFFSVVSDVTSDPTQYCNGVSFCEKARAFKYDVESQLDASQTPDLFYYCDACTPVFDDKAKSVSLPLSMGCDSTVALSKDL